MQPSSLGLLENKPIKGTHVNNKQSITFYQRKIKRVIYIKMLYIKKIKEANQLFEVIKKMKLFESVDDMIQL